MAIGAAHRLEPLLVHAFAGELPIRLRAWDGSQIGPDDAPTVVLRSRRALRRLLWAPGELGLAQAYVAGEIDLEGDLAEGLRRIWAAARSRQTPEASMRGRELIGAARLALRLGAVGWRPRPPAAQARLAGMRHSRHRDRAAIAHHYDLSNEFYQLVLDPQMAYSCGYWIGDPDDPTYTVADAQRDKLDLVCRKLGLEPGMRLLDVGCGWGALLVHAATHYGVLATGVTLSGQQQAFIRQRIEERGLTGRVEVRLQDYREIDDSPYDRVASLEMGEHVGQEQYPVYAANLFRLVKPAGRVLVQQMSRGAKHPGGGAFIESYVAPDMHMRPVGQTIELIEGAGLEVRDVEALREHYVWTIQAWYAALERNLSAAVALVGEQQVRVWRLYLVGSMLTFAENRMGVDQILAVKPVAGGASGMPRTRAMYTLAAGAAPGGAFADSVI
ncbi:MAG TPA: cyclopropane-fatty-acyl-phospholipid synthase family protein [Mycobacteriales bacterium]|nr:cyclopropane-fatty-acyl-phospholipid synthase family protein [Mycobacteriales bacterium]